LRLSLAALLLASCKGEYPPDTILLVNGEPITKGDLDAQLKLMGAGNFGQKPVKDPVGPKNEGLALDDLTDETLVLQEAGRLGVALSPEELENQVALARAGTSAAEFASSLQERGISAEAWRESVRRRALCDEVERRQIRAAIVVKPEDMRDYYWEHVTQFRRSSSVKLRQILCGSRLNAEKALGELRLGEPFAQVAMRYSVAPEGPGGGDLGWVQRKTLPKKLGKAAFALKKGAYSGIITTPYGWHILYAEDKEDERSFSLEQSQAEIMEDLIREREQPLYRDWLAALRRKAEIKHIDVMKGNP
jgi:parvulin-like peptidyl-prolyl isomerase